MKKLFLGIFISTLLFASSFLEHTDNNLSIKIDRKRNMLFNEMMYSFDVKSTQSGYVSIFRISEDNKLSILVKNEKISKNKLENLRDDNNKKFKARLLKRGIETYNVFIVLFSKDKLELDKISMDNFEEFLKDKTYTTLKTTVRPRV
jgi:hypothetical protein